jgi:guanylate kinase
MKGCRSGVKRKGKGLIFIISAPSGAGKTTLVRKALQEVPDLRFSVSYTTRPPRTSELEGEDYYFVSPATFQEMAKRDQFLEWSEVMGNLYGTARSCVAHLASRGIDLILDIDSQGARKVVKKGAHPILIYILPPSLKVLRERLMKRGLDAPGRVRLRMAHARRDMEEAKWYHYVVVNDGIEAAVEQLKAIITAERCREGKQTIIKKIVRVRT